MQALELDTPSDMVSVPEFAIFGRHVDKFTRLGVMLENLYC